MILSFDRVEEALDEMAEQFPTILFEELNGGVNLLEDAVEDPDFPAGEMYILGVLRRLPGAVYQSVLRVVCRAGGAGGLGCADLDGGAAHHAFPRVDAPYGKPKRAPRAG